MSYEALEALEALAENPHSVFSIPRDGSNRFNSIVKALLDPIVKAHSVLDEVYVEGLDASQVFGQTKMVLDGVNEKLLVEQIPALKAQYGTVEDEDSTGEDDQIDAEDDKESSFKGEESGSEDDDEEEEERALGGKSDLENLEDLSDEEDFQSAASEADTLNEEAENSDADTQVESDGESTVVEQKKDVFGLNDGFFDIDEFNRQTLALENDDDPLGNDDDDDIDFFGNLSDGDDEEDDMAYYDDFYDKPGTVRVVKAKNAKKTDDEEDEEEEEEDAEWYDKEYDAAVGSAMLDLFDEEDEKPQKEENLSSYEKQQQQLQAEIAQLEAELVADKKWTMKGEILSKDRPEDLLLDDPELHNLDFDRTSKPVPVITDEVTETIEDLIKRRIRNDEFDDLPKRLITDVARFHQKQKFELLETKSSRSLAELYEDDYNNVDAQQEKVSEEIQKAHDEISELFASVTHKLDLFYLAHFIPAPHQAKTIEVKVSDNAAASITMEDAQPVHVDSGTTLAPQEVYRIGDDRAKADGARGRLEVQLKSGLSYSKDELSREEKQRLRRANKRKKTKAYNELRDAREQRQKQKGGSEPDPKRRKVGEVIDTLLKAKNVTVIGLKGEMRDVKGNLKKQGQAQGSSGFKL